MVEIANIKDRDSLEAWLRDQPREVAVAIAVRTALRVMPFWWNQVVEYESADQGGFDEFSVLRCSLFSFIAAKMPNLGAKIDLAGAAFAASRPEGSGMFVSQTLDAARAVSEAALVLIERDSAAASAKAAERAGATYVNDEFFWHELRTDALSLSKGREILHSKLWTQPEKQLSDLWINIPKCIEDSKPYGYNPDDWTFWIKWYQSVLDGTLMLGDADRTWEMLGKIALIESDHWDAGPDVVNPMIHEIWDLYRLRVEVAALQAERDEVMSGAATVAHRSHNQPPDLIDADAELEKSVTIIWAGLDEARDELEKDEPDKAVLVEIAERLLAALASVATYCGKVADTAVMAAAKVGGGAVGTAVLDHLVNNGRLLQFAKDLLSFAGG